MAVNRYYSSIAVDTTLAVGIDASQTTLQVVSTTGFPTSYPYTLAIDYDTSTEELVNVVGAAGTTLTVGTTVGVGDISGRGVDQGSTYRQSHNSGAVVKHVISGRDLREAQNHIDATTSVHGIADTSTLITASSTVGLTNKTLNSTNTLDATTVTSITANSLNVSGTELGYLDGVTSAIQTQLGTKAPIASPTFTGTVTIPTGASITSPTITSPTITSGSVSSANVSFSGGGTLNVGVGTTTALIADATYIKSSEVAALSGVTSAIQTQIDSKVATSALGVWQTWSSATVNSAGWSGSWSSNKYVQIGKVVHFRGTFTLSGTPTGTAFNVSLPVTAAVSSNGVSGAGTGTVSGAGNPVFAINQTSTTAIDIRYLKDFGAAATGVVHAAITASLPGIWVSGNSITIYGTYEAA
jgi:hypothetical protein